MKKLLASLLVILSVVSGVRAQKIDSAAVARLNPELREEVNNYLIEAKKAKTTAMVMSIGGGSLALVGGVLVSIAAANDYVALFDWTSDYHTDKYNSMANVGGVLFVAGAACALGSIPFFIKVHKKRNAARAILFASNGVSFTPNIMMPGTGSAGISLIIPLGK